MAWPSEAARVVKRFIRAWETQYSPACRSPFTLGERRLRTVSTRGRCSLHKSRIRLHRPFEFLSQMRNSNIPIRVSLSGSRTLEPATLTINFRLNNREEFWHRLRPSHRKSRKKLHLCVRQRKPSREMPLTGLQKQLTRKQNTLILTLHAAAFAHCF